MSIFSAFRNSVPMNANTGTACSAPPQCCKLAPTANASARAMKICQWSFTYFAPPAWCDWSITAPSGFANISTAGRSGE